MSTPWRVEFDHPYVVTLKNFLREIVVGEFDYVRVGRVNGRGVFGQCHERNVCEQRKKNRYRATCVDYDDIIEKYTYKRTISLSAY